ncbi:hypothetical protein [Gracilibacillus phocaeensis]|nr:hypothetical protein [Gracilibacillus phocaeensis]
MMKAKGFKMITDDIAYLPFWENGIRYFIVEGVNGEKVEFCEVLGE